MLHYMLLLLSAQHALQGLTAACTCTLEQTVSASSHCAAHAQPISTLSRMDCCDCCSPLPQTAQGPANACPTYGQEHPEQRQQWSQPWPAWCCLPGAQTRCRSGPSCGPGSAAQRCRLQAPTPSWQAVQAMGADGMAVSGPDLCSMLLLPATLLMIGMLLRQLILSGAYGWRCACTLSSCVMM